MDIDDLFNTSGYTPPTYDLTETNLPTTTPGFTLNPTAGTGGFNPDADTFTYSDGTKPDGITDSVWDSIKGVLAIPGVASALIGAATTGAGAMLAGRASDKANDAANARNTQNQLFSDAQLQKKLEFDREQAELARRERESNYNRRFYGTPGGGPLPDYSGLGKQFDSQFILKREDIPQLIGPNVIKMGG